MKKLLLYSLIIACLLLVAVCATGCMTSCEIKGHEYADATCTAPQTCKVCGTTVGETLEHEYAEATCTLPQTCTKCNATTGQALGHEYADATCTLPQTCKVCGATVGEPLEHEYADATCTLPQTCIKCNATMGQALGHEYADATCTVPQTCIRCASTQGQALEHEYADATCTAPQTCIRCASTQGQALEHEYADATCTAPQTCIKCNATTGQALGHNYAFVSCTLPRVCTVCHASDIQAAGHTYVYGVCSLCQDVHTGCVYVNHLCTVCYRDECDDATPLTYTPSRYPVNYNELNEEIFYDTVNLYSSEYAIYYIEESIATSLADEYINYAEQALARLNFEKQVEIFLFEEYDGYFTECSTATSNVPVLGLQINNGKSVDALVQLVLLKCGAYANYGVAYGYADWLHAQLRWGEGYLPDDDVTPNRRATYDLNYLCFDTDFTSTDDVITAKNLGVAFVEDYLQTHTEQELLELLTSSGNPNDFLDFYYLLADWYQAMEVSYTPIYSLYASGGVNNSYTVLLGNHAQVYVRKGYSDSEFGDNYLQHRYYEVRAFFNSEHQQMDAVVTDIDLPPADTIMIFQNADLVPSIGRSHYNPNTHICIINGETAFIHEYVHAVTYAYINFQLDWATEAIAMYYAGKHDKISNDTDNDIIANLYRYADSAGKKMYSQFLEYMNDEVDLNVCYRDYMDYMSVVMSYTSPDDEPEGDYYAGCSLIYYCVELYGEEAVENWLFDYNYNFVKLPKNYAQLVAEWQTYIEQKFEGYDFVKFEAYGS